MPRLILIALFLTNSAFAQIQAQPSSVQMFSMGTTAVDPQMMQRQQQEQDFKNQLFILEQQRQLETQRQTNIIQEQQSQIQSQEEEIGQLNSELDQQKMEIDELELEKEDLEREK